MKNKSKLEGYVCWEHSPILQNKFKIRTLAKKVKSLSKRKNLKISFLKNACWCGNPRKRNRGPMQYTIYCIVNSGFFTTRGNLAAAVARGLLGIYNKIDKDRVKAQFLDRWEESGENLVVLRGINHKHLKYLAKELRFVAVDIYPLYKTWGRSQIMLVLSVLGRQEDVDEVFEGLSYYR